MALKVGADDWSKYTSVTAGLTNSVEDPVTLTQDGIVFVQILSRDTQKFFVTATDGTETITKEWSLENLVYIEPVAGSQLWSLPEDLTIAFDGGSQTAITDHNAVVNDNSDINVVTGSPTVSYSGTIVGVDQSSDQVIGFKLSDEFANMVTMPYDLHIDYSLYNGEDRISQYSLTISGSQVKTFAMHVPTNATSVIVSCVRDNNINMSITYDFIPNA